MPNFASYPDGGLNCIKMRIRHHRDTSTSDAEKTFWTHTISVWTPERDVAFAHLWNARATTREILAQLPFLPNGKKGIDMIYSRVAYLRATAHTDSERAFWAKRKSLKTYYRRCAAAKKIRHSHATRSLWDPARTAQLAFLCSRGESATDIARALGCFESSRDGGRSAVLGKIDRMRRQACDAAEREFWICVDGRSRGAQKRKERGNVDPRSAQKATRSPGKHRTAPKRVDIDALIASVVVPPVVTTPEDVRRDMEQRMLMDALPETFTPWVLKRRALPEKEPDHVPFCTLTVGDGPCREPAVPRTARCTHHGGEQIACIEYKAEQHMQPWLHAAE